MGDRYHNISTSVGEQRRGDDMTDDNRGRLCAIMWSRAGEPFIVYIAYEYVYSHSNADNTQHS